MTIRCWSGFAIPKLVDLFGVRVSVGDASQHISWWDSRGERAWQFRCFPTKSSTFRPLPIVTAVYRNTVGHRHHHQSLEAMSTHQAVRRWIMTGAVAAITVTGTIYGADLKGYQDAKQVCWHALSTQATLSIACVPLRVTVRVTCFALPRNSLADVESHSKSDNCLKLPPRNESPNSKQHAPN